MLLNRLAALPQQRPTICELQFTPTPALPRENTPQMGKAVVDETEKGWYIQWVDRDPRLLAMQEAAARREKADLDDEEKQVCCVRW